jgi:hypothetical protein
LTSQKLVRFDITQVDTKAGRAMQYSAVELLYFFFSCFRHLALGCSHFFVSTSITETNKMNHLRHASSVNRFLQEVKQDPTKQTEVMAFLVLALLATCCLAV